MRTRSLPLVAPASSDVGSTAAPPGDGRKPSLTAFGTSVLAAVAVALTVVAMLLGSAGRAAAVTPWSWPVEPAEVVNGFDPPDVVWGSGHRGVDLAAAVGQVVHAPAPGTVTFAGVIAGRGVVVVSHGDVRTTYEPVDAGVEVGAAVSTGAALGTLQGFAFHCSAPCLHWGAIRGTTYLDPTSFVVVKPSRLLPVWGGTSSARATQNGPPVTALPGRSSPLAMSGIPPLPSLPGWPRADADSPSAGRPSGSAGAAVRGPADGAARDTVVADGESTMLDDVTSAATSSEWVGAAALCAALATLLTLLRRSSKRFSR